MRAVQPAAGCCQIHQALLPVPLGGAMPEIEQMLTMLVRGRQVQLRAGGMQGCNRAHHVVLRLRQFGGLHGKQRRAHRHRCADADENPRDTAGIG